MSMEPSPPNRAMPGATGARKEIEERHGEVLSTMQRLRDRAVSDLAGSHPEKGSDIALLGIAAKAIDVFDSVRLLLEAGKSSEALAAARTLYDLDMDAHLLAHSRQGETLLLRYSSFEILEKAQLLTKLREYGEQEADERSNEVIAWMIEAIEQSGKQVPSGFDDLPLREASEALGKLLFGSMYPSSWRHKLSREALYHWWAESEAEAKGEERTEQQVKERSDQLRKDGQLIYSIMSARLHGSPASARELVRVVETNVQLLLPAPVAKLIPLICDVATVDFVRVQGRVARSLAIERDEEAWRAELSVVQGT